MKYTLFTYASRVHSRVKLLAISDIHQYINIVRAHKYDGYVQHKCLTCTILNCLNAALFLASNPPTSSNPDLHEPGPARPPLARRDELNYRTRNYYIIIELHTY